LVTFVALLLSRVQILNLLLWVVAAVAWVNVPLNFWKETEEAAERRRAKEAREAMAYRLEEDEDEDEERWWLARQREHEYEIRMLERELASMRSGADEVPEEERAAYDAEMASIRNELDWRRYELNRPRYE